MQLRAARMFALLAGARRLPRLLPPRVREHVLVVVAEDLCLAAQHAPPLLPLHVLVPGLAVAPAGLRGPRRRGVCPHLAQPHHHAVAAAVAAVVVGKSVVVYPGPRILEITLVHLDALLVTVDFDAIVITRTGAAAEMDGFCTRTFDFCVVLYSGLPRLLGPARRLRGGAYDRSDSETPRPNGPCNSE